MGLEALHALGIIHRDIKPGNIMIDNLGRCKLIDLGLAARDKTVKVSSGTRNYAAPETVNREVQSLVSDFYSLGIILYELIFGEKPYVKETWD